MIDFITLGFLAGGDDGKKRRVEEGKFWFRGGNEEMANFENGKWAV